MWRTLTASLTISHSFGWKLDGPADEVRWKGHHDGHLSPPDSAPCWKPLYWPKWPGTSGQQSVNYRDGGSAEGLQGSWTDRVWGQTWCSDWLELHNEAFTSPAGPAAKHKQDMKSVCNTGHLSFHQQSDEALAGLAPLLQAAACSLHSRRTW